MSFWKRQKKTKKKEKRKQKFYMGFNASNRHKVMGSTF
jgi:hypothetical protein